MKKGLLFTLVLVVFGSFLFMHIAFSGEKDKSLVQYPEGYRTWTHVKSMVIQKGHPMHDVFGGIHHIYANEEVLKALKDSTPYPDGSVIVFDLLEAKSKNKTIVEGPRKYVAVMQKGASKFADTGGWGFEVFKGDSKERAVTDPKNDCFLCHKSQILADFVFSKYRP